MLWLCIMLSIIILDRISKFIIINVVNVGHMQQIIGNFFYITHIENRGAAWGLFQNGRVILILSTILMLIGLGYYLYSVENKLYRISLCLIIGGAVGNLIDRVFRGSVVDFLDFYVYGYHFPTFNIADSCIVVGAVMLITGILTKEKKEGVM